MTSRWRNSAPSAGILRIHVKMQEAFNREICVHFAMTVRNCRRQQPHHLVSTTGREKATTAASHDSASPSRPWRRRRVPPKETLGEFGWHAAALEPRATRAAKLGYQPVLPGSAPDIVALAHILSSPTLSIWLPQGLAPRRQCREGWRPSYRAWRALPPGLGCFFFSLFFLLKKKVIRPCQCP